jgi:hypothetical protein
MRHDHHPITHLGASRLARVYDDARRFMPEGELR